jgi:hypothetical protein
LGFLYLLYLNVPTDVFDKPSWTSRCVTAFSLGGLGAAPPLNHPLELWVSLALSHA